MSPDSKAKIGAVIGALLLLAALWLGPTVYRHIEYRAVPAKVVAVSRDGCKLAYQGRRGTNYTRLLTCADAGRLLAADHSDDGYYLVEQMRVTYQYTSPVDGSLYPGATTQMMPAGRLTKLPTVGAAVSVMAHRTISGRSFLIF